MSHVSGPQSEDVSLRGFAEEHLLCRNPEAAALLISHFGSS